MKKNLLLVGILAVAISTQIGITKSYSQESVAQEDQELQEVESNVEIVKRYYNFKGEVKAIEIGEENQRGFVLVEGEEDTIRFNINKNVFLVEGTEGQKIELGNIQEGDIVNIFYSVNAPMSLSLPPQITPEVLVLTSEDSMQANFNYFDKDFLAYDESLKLNISEDTKVLDMNGKTVDMEEADLADKKLLVFYGPTTRSIPPQTNPILIYVFEDITEEIPAEIADVEGDSVSYKKFGYDMLPLGQVARERGYTVTWDSEHQVALLNNSLYTFKITVGEAEIERVKLDESETKIIDMTVEAEITNGTLFVQSDFFDYFIESKSN